MFIFLSMNSFSKFFYHFFVEGFKILWASTGYQALVNYYFLILPIYSCIFQVCFD